MAETVARRLGVSRSELYSKAIAAFLSKQDADAITARLNEVYSEQAAEVDPAHYQAELESLPDERW